MIALAVLGLIASFTAVQIKKLLDVHSFETSVSKLYSDLQDAQLLAASYQTDFVLDLYRKDGQWFYQLSTYEPFKPFMKIPHEGKIDATRIQFNGKSVEKLHFDLFSGCVEPRGILAFFRTDEEDGQKLWLDLQYGHLIKFAHHKPSMNKQELPAFPK